MNVLCVLFKETIEIKVWCWEKKLWTIVFIDLTNRMVWIYLIEMICVWWRVWIDTELKWDE